MEEESERENEQLSPEVESSDIHKSNTKRRLRKCFIVVGLVMMVGAILFSSSLFMFIRSDSCDLLCHTPMNSYVTSYYDSEGQYLVSQHASAGFSCDQCHIITVFDQFSMSFVWLNDYIVNGKTRILESQEYDYEGFCLRPECHAPLNVEDFAIPYKGTLLMNPHRDLGLMCSDCHSAHDQIVIRNNLDCTLCHGSQELLTVAITRYVINDELWANPHTLVDWLTTTPSLIHSSPNANIMNCSACHGNHVLPYAASTSAKTANVYYCFRACHHTNDFVPCTNCHR